MYKISSNLISSETNSSSIGYLSHWYYYHIKIFQIYEIIVRMIFMILRILSADPTIKLQANYIKSYRAFLQRRIKIG
jgi:hypothetical protein